MSEVIKGMLTGSASIFQLAIDGKVRKYIVGNIFILGVLFGLSNLYGTLQTTPELPLDGKFAIITPFIFSSAGIVTICGALIAFTLVYWSAAVAFGGYGGFGLIISLIGMAAIPFWFLAPLLNFTLNYTTADSNQIILYIIIVLAFIWSFTLIRQSLITGQGLGKTKAGLAVILMWVFSISSIYVFIP